MADALAVLPRSMGTQLPGADKKPEKKAFIPQERGGLLTENPNEIKNPYTFSDSPAYTAQKKAEESAKRAAELEGKDETRGFLKSVEDLGKKHKWEEAFQLMERRTAIPSGLFLVTRAVLRWKFHRYNGALSDVTEALKNYSSCGKSANLAAAFSSFARICLGSSLKDQTSCSKEMRSLVEKWASAEKQSLERHSLGQGLFRPREEIKLSEPSQVVEGMEAHDGTYIATTGVKIGYVFLKNLRDLNAPVLVHFHGTAETAADYRKPELAKKYRDLPVHLVVVDYRGYGWSSDKPSLATFLQDAEPFVEKLPEILVLQGLSWPYTGGFVLSGRSLGAQVAVHMATMFPTLFRWLILDSAMAISATGDRLGRAPERTEVLECWHKELAKSSLEILEPLDSELWCLSVPEKIRAYDGRLLVVHGLVDEIVPFEGSESLHAAASSRQKELVLVEGAGHNNIGHFDTYWSVQRRFCLKVQLDDTISTIGNVQHLCAVCAEKAVSKCGRCQKVWYCCRGHQAEHWKTHKQQCAGGPPEPKPKVDPESDACLVVAVALEITSPDDVAALSTSLESIGEQEQKPHAVYISWHASSDELTELTLTSMQDFTKKVHPLKVVASKTSKASTQFEHIAAMVGGIAQDEPGHTWVVCQHPFEVWSPKYVTELMPALRRAAADQRVIAVSCTTQAKSASDTVELPRSVSQVQAALEAGTAKVVQGDFPRRTADIVVRAKTLQAFVETTPQPVVGHEMCAHRFVYKITHTYGKKVQKLKPAETEWMLWVPNVRESASVSKNKQDDADQQEETKEGASAQVQENLDGVTDIDRVIGQTLYEGVKQTQKLESPSDAAKSISSLRQNIERRLVIHAGEQMSSKDLKNLSMEVMNSFLKEVSLDEVVGLQRWAKLAAAEIADKTVKQFMITIVTDSK